MNPVYGPVGRPAAIGVTAAALVLLSACASAGSAAGARGASTASTTSASSTPTSQQVLRQALRTAETDAENLSSVTDTFSVRARGALSSTTTGVIRTQLKPVLKATADIRSDASGVNSHMKSISTGDAVYMYIGSGRRPGLTGKPWVRFGLTGLKDSAAAVAGAMAGLTDESPIAQGADIGAHLRLSELATDVHVAGRELIGGVPTTEYAGSYRPHDILNALSASDRKLLTSELPSMFSGTGLVYFREWIDGRHHLRKQVEVSTTDGTTTTSTDYYTAFNQPVRVMLPPASQVTEIFNL